MGYQHEHEKRPCKMCIYLPPAYRVHGNNYSACHFLVNLLERLHAISLPLSLFKLERKKQVVIVICRRLTWALGMILVSKLLCTLK